MPVTDFYGEYALFQNAKGYISIPFRLDAGNAIAISCAVTTVSEVVLTVQSRRQDLSMAKRGVCHPSLYSFVLNEWQKWHKVAEGDLDFLSYHE